MRRKYYLSFLLSFVSFALFAQSGEVSGKIVDENGEAIPFANVSIVENGKPTGTGATTDFDGFYAIKPLSAGKYDIKFSYIGYTSVIKAGVLVKNDQSTYLDQKMSPSAMKVEEVVVVRYKIPLIDAGATSTAATMTAEDISNLPTRDVTDIASTTAGVTKKDGEVHFRGSRGDAVVYYVDGIRVNGKVNLPVTAVEQIDVVTGGVPSRFGEATGGVINISTKGGARKFTGGIEVLESLDRWRYDLINLNVAGPIIKNKEKDKTILGFAMSAEYLHQLDPTPSAVSMYKVKDEILEDLQKEPLYLDESGRILLKTQSITFDDLEENRINPNVRSHDIRGNLKFDIRLNDNMKMSVGGGGDYNINHERIDRYSLFNYENNPENNTLNYRGFVRFTHNIKKKASEDGEETSKGIFQNGFYQVQVGYEKDKALVKDDSHGDNSFAYGYIGSFITERDAVYSSDKGYYNLESYEDVNVKFKPSDVNERGANFTTQYYQLSGAELDSEGYYSAPGEFPSLGSFSSTILRNGQRADKPYDLWYNTGRQYNSHGLNRDNDQFSATISGGFDILKKGAESRNKHSISLGFTFEQRVQRTYTISPLGRTTSPNGLFDIADRLVNSHIELNQDELWVKYAGGDSLVINGVTPLYMNDTVTHYYGFKEENGELAKQSTFDRKLREKLGVSSTEYIDIMSLPLETFTRDMFSADELLNNGNELITYRGYDVYGNIANNIKFKDFWTAKNDEGEYTRPIAAFTPVYMAGYIEDKFQLKDLTFRIGFRADRYDANQMVLKDIYSLVGSQTVGEARNVVAGTIPDNIGDDYVIYVDKQNDPTVLGFRNGNTWYNTEGVPLASYTALPGSPVPLLPVGQEDHPNKEGYDTDLAFEKYEADWNFMPRLQFSFNISDNALFFAHYDVLSQSPQSRNIGNPLDYYFHSTDFRNNPNLKSETTIDFQLGFKQKLNKSSALTFAAYFKEFKDQIQIRRVDGVFPNPTTYYTYDNIDFGNTKGFEFGYEMRRTNNLKLNVNYTLQFADGTGSDDQTQLDIVRASDANFRNVSALDFDSRHLMNLIVDYRFGSGDDYNGPTTKKGAQILSNFGVNLLTQLRSGTPYTRNASAYAVRSLSNRETPSEGTLNGSRIGWNFNMDLKVNKSFALDIKSKKEDKEGATLNFDVYLRIDNLLGMVNVTDVYKYTGSANEDGWLGSPQGNVAVTAAENSQSYKDLYKVGLNDQSNYALPRRVFVGASVYF